MYVPDPVRGLHGDKALEMIERQAGTKISETKTNILQGQEAHKHALSAQDDNAHAKLGTDIVASAAGLDGMASLMDAVAERHDAATRPSASLTQDMHGFIGDNVQTMDEFARGGAGAGLFELCNVVSKSLTGKSDATGDLYKSDTANMRGTDTVMTQTREVVANEHKRALAQRMIQERDREYGYQAQAHGMAPMGMGGGYNPQLALNRYAPKGPNFSDDDAAGAVGV